MSPDVGGIRGLSEIVGGLGGRYAKATKAQEQPNRRWDADAGRRKWDEKEEALANHNCIVIFSGKATKSDYQVRCGRFRPVELNIDTGDRATNRTTPPSSTRMAADLDGARRAQSDVGERERASRSSGLSRNASNHGKRNQRGSTRFFSASAALRRADAQGRLHRFVGAAEVREGLSPERLHLPLGRSGVFLHHGNNRFVQPAGFGTPAPEPDDVGEVQKDKQVLRRELSRLPKARLGLGVPREEH